MSVNGYALPKAINGNHSGLFSNIPSGMHSNCPISQAMKGE